MTFLPEDAAGWLSRPRPAAVPPVLVKASTALEFKQNERRQVGFTRIG
jgi:hypothetical protein